METAQTADTADAALRAHVQATDVAMGARFDKAEAGLREALAALDVGLRKHPQEAVGET